MKIKLKELQEERDLANEKWAREEQAHQEALTRAITAEKKESETAKKLFAVQSDLENERSNRSLDLSQSISGPASSESARIQKLVNEKRNLSLEVQSLKEARDSAEARSKSLSATVEKLQKQVSTLEESSRCEKAPKTRGAGAGAQAADQVLKIKGLEQELKEKESKAAELLAKVRALESELKDRDSKLAESQKSSKKAATADSKQAAALQARMESVESDLAGARRECMELKDAAARERAERAAESLALQQQKAEMERRVKSAESEKDKGQRGLAAKMEALRTEASALKESNQELVAKQEGQKVLFQQEKELLLQRIEELKRASAEAAAARDAALAASAAAEGGAGEKRRRGGAGRFSVEASDALKERLAGLQTQFLAMSKRDTSAVASATTAAAAAAASSKEVEEARQAAAALRKEVSALKQERDDLFELTQQQERFIGDVELRIQESERRRVRLHNLVQVRRCPQRLPASCAHGFLNTAGYATALHPLQSIMRKFQ